KGGVWALNEVLSRTAETLAAAPTPARCIVLLGGLAVRQPAPQLEVEQLRGSVMIVAGWRGLQRVQTAWKKALAPAGASIVFLTEAATDTYLLDDVRACLDGKARKPMTIAT